MQEKLNKELERCVDALSKINPTSEDYVKVLDRISDLRYLITYYVEAHVIPGPILPPKPTTVTAQTPETPAPEPKSEVSSVEAPKKSRSKAKIEPQPETVENTEVEPTEEAKADKPTYEEVRAAFSEAAANGVKVKEILARYVPEGKSARLTSVPEENYAAILKEVTEYAG